MAIFDKPFSFDEMLRRTIFKGRPNFFNANDLNKELLTLHKFMEEFNSKFGVSSNLKFVVPSFTNVTDFQTDTVTRSISMNWDEGWVLYKGVRFSIPSGGIAGYSQTYQGQLVVQVSGGSAIPPTYIVLRGELKTVNYAQNPVLCGIQSNEFPSTVPTVDVEQYQNVRVELNADPEDTDDVICILGIIYQKYSDKGEADGYGFIDYTFVNDTFNYTRTSTSTPEPFQSNNSMYEYLIERVILKLRNVLNEKQLVARFNLADLVSAAHARANIGFSKLVNQRQLVLQENLRDVPNKAMARQNLALGNSATRSIGYSEHNVAPGNIVPIGSILLWSGASSSVPNGWKLCDGNNGTPNLSGRFVVGFDTGNPKFNSVGSKGGAERVKLTADETGVGKHKHTGFTATDGVHSHALEKKVVLRNIGDNALTNIKNIPGDDASIRTMIDGAHKHALDMNDASAPAQEAHENLPPYYTLCYIMHVGATLPLETMIPPEPAVTYPNYSIPTSTTESGYTSNEETIGGSNGVTIGSGITHSNPD